MKAFENIYRFLVFIFGLLLCRPLKSHSDLDVETIIVTPLRNIENCWVDYYIAVRFSVIAKTRVIMMKANALPFGNFENKNSIKAKVFLQFQLTKMWLVLSVLKLKGIDVDVIDRDEGEDHKVNDVSKLSAAEFMRRYYGTRDYHELADCSQEENVQAALYSLYSYLEKNVSVKDVLITSHGIYEWSVAFNYMSSLGAQTFVWGANIYNSGLLKISDEPQQVGWPMGNYYIDRKVDLETRLAGKALDQPFVWRDSLGGELLKIREQFNRVLLLAPNCIWDGDSDVRDSHFNGVVDWVEKTINFCSLNPDIGLIIRVHPAEGSIWAKRPSLWKYLQSLESHLPKNCFIISPKENTSTLELSDLADLTLFYSGIIGVEALLRGNKVLCVSKSIYGFIDGINKCQSEADYYSVLYGGSEEVDTGKVLKVEDVFDKGLKIHSHPGSGKTMFTNPKFLGYMKQPEFDKFIMNSLPQKSS